MKSKTCKHCKESYTLKYKAQMYRCFRCSVDYKKERQLGYFGVMGIKLKEQIDAKGINV